MAPTHRYRSTVTWQGNRGTGTADYRGYSRRHTLRFPGKPDLPGSSDPVFRGDPERYNPEELLVAALAACHMLWYLHLCADAGVRVEAYADEAEGTLEVTRDGGGRFTQVILHPKVAISAGSAERARALHQAAHDKCFIANSVNFPVEHQPEISEVSARA